MKKRWFYLLMISGLLSGFNSWAQTGESYSKCSPQTMFLLNQYQKKELNQSSLVELTGSSTEQVRILFKVASEEGWNELQNAGALIKFRKNDLGTAVIAIDQLGKIVKSSNLRYVELATPLKTDLDKARELSNANKALRGEGLPMPYKGKGVIVGIVDVGFDYTHPTFYDKDGKNYRVSWAWDQNISLEKPQRMKPEELFTRRYSEDSETQQHGTHVAGIAAGSGLTSISIGDLLKSGYSGIAPESELCLVATTMMSDDIIAGVHEIFNYAKECGKPCVVNLSLGSSFGPMDGTGLFSEAVSSMSGPGHIVVVSAGNEGSNPTYLDMNAKGDTINTLVATNPSETYAYVDLWSKKKLTDFSVSVGIYDKDTKSLVAKSDYYKVSSLKEKDKPLTLLLNDTCEVEIAANLYEANKKYNSTIHYTTKGLKENEIYVLSFTGDAGVNARAAKFCDFVNNGFDDEIFKKGRTDHSMGTPADGLNVISVGNYVSRLISTSPVGSIAPSSSYGPTYDGRLCPVVAAPGMSVNSSFNGKYVVTNKIKARKSLFRLNNYYWGEMTGTSMSAPYVTGTVALWLQANPLLTPDDIKGVIARTAIHDDFTGNCPNERWGYGKMDTYRGLLDILSLPTSNENILVEHPEEAVAVYADAASDEITVRWAEQPEYFTIEVFDMSGRRICIDQVNQANTLEHVIPMSTVDGVYVVKINTEKGKVMRKVVL